MAETTPPEGTTPTSPPAAAPEAPAEAAATHEPTPLTIRALLEAGAHFGHQTHRWDPKMRQYIFGERNGVHIVDLDQTLVMFEEALEFLRETVAAGGKVLFVGTKRQAAPSVASEASRAGQFYVNNRWLGGTLTNFRTVRKSLDRFKEQLEVEGDEERVSELSKKDRSRLSRSLTRYRKALDGLKEMTKLPDAMFAIDVKREHIAIREAQRLGIPIVAVVDTNCNPRDIDFVVPGNDDATRAITLYCAKAADACLEGAMLHEERVRSEAAEQATRKQEEAATPSTGRVVVEIKQPPRRGRGARAGTRGGGTHTAGAEPLVDDEKPEAAAPAPAAAAPAAAAETPEPAAESPDTKG